MLSPIQSSNDHRITAQEEIPEEPIAPEDELSDSPFAKMFPSGATRKEVQRFIDQAMHMIVLEIKRSTERWKKSQRRMRNVIEGRREDD
jgi:hypothetical protein